ncbi:hypothetical protein [Microbulbifer marinus]|uniref:hypothetical protein n=1 Tax=Microbulbifer marinus TaxID=658218 RepID=UPI0011154731|nr:hypothetical protein [Microbulbifer marinus]
MKNYQRRVIGILTLGGSFTGVVLSAEQLMSVSGVMPVLIYVAFTALYAWGVWLGIAVLENLSKFERGLSKFWCLQIPAFWSPIFGYFFTSGFHLTVFINLSGLSVTGNFQAGSVFKFSLLQSGQPWQVGVNIFAVGVVLFLSKSIRSSEKGYAPSSAA